MEKGFAFGEQWLFEQNKEKILEDDLIMSDKGIVAEITHEVLFECIGGSIETVLKKNLSSHEVKYMKKFDSTEANKYSHLKLEELVYIKKLGKEEYSNLKEERGRLTYDPTGFG